MTTRRPSFQFYPSDWLSSQRVALMTLEEEGAYIRALCYCWNHGSIPSDLDQLARLLGKGGSTTVARVVATMFQPDVNDGSRLVHSRLDAERAKQDAWAEKSSSGGKKSAELRQNLKGGSTTVARVVEKWLEPNGNSSSSTPSSSSSSTSTTISTTKDEDISASAPRVTSRASKFTPPTREELNREAEAIGLPSIEVDKFVNHYGAVDWKVGRNPMKSWTHALGGWKSRWMERQHANNGTVNGRAISGAEERKRLLDRNLYPGEREDLSAPPAF